MREIITLEREAAEASRAGPAAKEELVKILATLKKKGFSIEAHGEFKRVPKGFEADHPRADLLKYKGLIAVDFVFQSLDSLYFSK